MVGDCNGDCTGSFWAARKSTITGGSKGVDASASRSMGSSTFPTISIGEEGSWSSCRSELLVLGGDHCPSSWSNAGAREPVMEDERLEGANEGVGDRVPCVIIVEDLFLSDHRLESEGKRLPNRVAMLFDGDSPDLRFLAMC